MNASEIRQKFLEYQEKLGHKVIAPAPLVLENDPTTLFTGSGMQPLLPYLLGKEHKDGKRLTDSQPSMRLQDIEDVGDPRHTTVFEMLGNWSLGDYFKKEQIPAFFEFLTKVVGLDPNKIYVTCFIGNEKYGIPKDTEAAEIWQEVFKKAGIDAKIAEIGSAENGDKRGVKPGEHIFFYDDHENWWSRGGGIETTPIGDPCGPDSEVFYDFGEDKQDVEKYGKSHPASDGARFMEIGNQVFMQYKRNEDGTFSELEKKNVDFGGGLERIAAASIDSFDVFKISLLKPIIDKLEEISGKGYENNTDEMRIIADHLRGAYLLSSQGLKPSNKQQGYALRRLIRRAILKALDLGIAQNFISEIIPIIAKNYEDLPDSILTTREDAVATLEKEEKAFRQTLNKGLRELDKMTRGGIALGAPSRASKRIQADSQVCERLGQAASEHGGEDMAMTGPRSERCLTGYDLFKLQDTYGFPYEISVEEIFKRNIPLSKNYKAEFDEALEEQRNRSKTASKGMFKGGLEDHGETTTKYHTATHLTLAALQKLLDKNIGQQGSNITSERMRFDFNFERKLTPEEKQAVENQVNEWIAQDLPVSFAEYDKDYAKNTLKAHGQFWEKYPDKVKVYTIGDPENPVSREVCGGPHVEHTGEIGKYKIKKEESSSAGVRRIKAVIE
ncbi:MAG: alanine--tRNA ligase-related protein [Candidatus Saccharibacteria bacterium]|nr:alanine--tRNA ligase-related protein [Candidatus Saccharibacteria bacterium]